MTMNPSDWIELKAIRALLASEPRPDDPTPERLRERLVKLTDQLPRPGDLSCESADAGGVPGLWFPAATGAERTVLYLHGGGYVVGSVQTHCGLTHRLAVAAGSRVLSIDYRLAPEHPFPAALEDAVTAYRWLLDTGTEPGAITIAGDSAGGGLVVATALCLKERGLPLPAALVCFSPWVDMEATGESMDSRADVDPMVSREGLLWFAGMYLAGADPRTPLAAPLHADLSGLPPVLVQVGDAETLLDDSTRLAERMREAGTPVTLEVWDHMIHVWQLMAPLLGEGRRAITQAGRFIRDNTG